MKTIVFFLSLAFLAGTINVASQNCTFYFPKKVGTILETKYFKAKDNKLTSVTKTKIKEQTAGSIKYSSEVADDKGKILNSGDYEVKCKNGEFVMDMNSFMSSMNLSAYKDMEVHIETDEMSLPAKLQPGQLLNNGEIRMKISNKGFTIMTTTITISNRKVIGVEDVTTSAGTFKCTKISYDVDTKSIVNFHSKGIEFISEKVGIVRTESYDTKDKLVGYAVLSTITE